ncbi:ABC transporter permease [Paracrocinitomix mangrovi]|uniref:ABC transporter permease subunit n=1 Tax=Paracrocinitomix mangrovi TaxID=2862509 RepID=UPI001C8D8012|nr:ABC transporter permease subunit [Paracrocinitomix mangrovi]UKN01720.1 ABC transporter permease [Paracrocinitomix mangrovi]
MNKNLYLKELRRNRKNLITWTLIVVGFTVMVLSIYPFMSEMGKDMAMLIDSMPVELQKAMGMDADTWRHILGFYSTYYGIYIIVLISIYTASTGATIISKEERDRTAEFLLTKPLKRSEIVFTKIMSLLTLTLIIYLIQLLSAVLGVMAFGKGTFEWDTFFILHISGLALIILFTTIGVIISMFVRPKKNFMGIVVGITFGSYFINAISKSTDATSWLGYFTPFHYLDFNVNDPEYSLNYLAVIIYIILGASLLYITNLIYNKKDIEG